MNKRATLLAWTFLTLVVPCSLALAENPCAQASLSVTNEGSVLLVRVLNAAGNSVGVGIYDPSAPNTKPLGRWAWMDGYAGGNFAFPGVHQPVQVRAFCEWPTGTAPTSAQADFSQPVPPSAILDSSCMNQFQDNLFYGTCGVAPSHQNYTNVFPDAVLSSTDGRLQLTMVPSLGYAIASLKFFGQELVATGGHGSSFGYNLRPIYSAAPYAGSPTECDNPTEDGSADDNSANLSDMPWLTPSSTRIDGSWQGYAGAAPQFSSEAELAYYLPEFQNSVSGSGPCTAYWNANGGKVHGRLSGFHLYKWITMGTSVNGTFYPNVIQFDSRITVPRDVESLNVELAAYLTRTLKHELFYDPRNDVLFVKSPGEAKTTPGFNNSTSSPVVRIFSDDAFGTAVGVLTPPERWYSLESSLATEYSMTQLDTSAPADYTYQYRILASQHHFSNISGSLAAPALLSTQNQVEAHSWYIVGSVDKIKIITRQFCQQWGICQ